ncbi:MAG: hypothetical protein LC768_10655 [Acidobacteria bacterium]|nr:hypothetical protein [Acidobacteriota bacterium]MCA1638774.1 hypothetical protein [Acidobacteriota bacterium]
MSRCAISKNCCRNIPLTRTEAIEAQLPERLREGVIAEITDQGVLDMTLQRKRLELNRIEAEQKQKSGRRLGLGKYARR